MKLLATSVAALTLLTVPALAQNSDTSPSPNQRAMQKPNSSDPATTVPGSSSGSSEGYSSGEAGTGVIETPRDPALDQPDDADPKAAEPNKPKE